MILAPTLTLNALRGPSVDPDVAAYVATSGATDVAALSTFVKGVKELGLWDDMVCWPLRSTQNAGTGTTAYSLGGLGTFNGTLVNGPTWGADGITLGGTGPRITTSYNLSTTHSSVVAAKFTQTGSSSLWGHSSTVSPEGFLSFGSVSGGARIGMQTAFPPGGSANTYVTTAAAGLPALNTFFQGFASWSPTEVLVGHDATNASQNWPQSLVTSSALNNIILGSSFGGQGGTSSKILTAVNMFNIRLSTEQITAFRDLYKQTLGVGLSLP
jgi:hypothetical protein